MTDSRFGEPLCAKIQLSRCKRLAHRMAVYREELNGLATLISELCQQPYAFSVWCTWSHITLNLFLATKATSSYETPASLCQVTPIGQRYLLQSVIHDSQLITDGFQDSPKSLETTINAINALAANILSESQM